MLITNYYALYHGGMTRLEKVRGVILGVLALLAVVVWWPGTRSAPGTSGQYLTVSFLDVGQGDAIHIETPDGYEMLIDGGPSALVLRELAKGRSFFDKDIDVVVATHPDTDHIAGLVDVLGRYDIGMIVESAAGKETATAKAFDNAAGAEGSRHVIAQAGQTIALGASTTIRILSPHGDATDWETNTASVVVQVVYGDIEFMLTGDAPSSIEEYLASTAGVLPSTSSPGRVAVGLASDVLKLGHHGSKTSSSKIFLEAVHPQYVVVSAGKDNRYGHPTAEALARASSAGARIVSTIDNGTIVFESDGKEVWVK